MHAALVETALGGPPGADWQAPLLDALDVLRELNIKKQVGLFPAALTPLGPDDWEPSNGSGQASARPAPRSL